MGGRWLLLAVAVLVACAEGREELGQASLEISGGAADANDTAVVGIYIDSTGATCTGTLIAPNLVLTARHCVAGLPPTFECTSAFGPEISGSVVYVTTEANMNAAAPADFYQGAAVVVEPGPGLLCGDDIALVVLESNIPAGEAAPITPRVDASPTVGEIYSAVGYGATSDFGTDGGERRRRDGLTVDCLGTSCGPSTDEREWVGNEGICPGDSGGPALDAEGRVFGVVSRGAAGCVLPTYSDVAQHQDWLIAEAIAAAADGGYPTPVWAGGEPPGTGGAGGAGGAGGGGTPTSSSGGAEPTAGGAGGAPSTDGHGGADAGDDESDDDGCRFVAAPAGNASAATLFALTFLAALRRRQRVGQLHR